MFGALKRGRFRSLAIVFLILVVNVVGELQRKRTLAASRGFLAAARLSCKLRYYFVCFFLRIAQNGAPVFNFAWHADSTPGIT